MNIICRMKILDKAKKIPHLLVKNKINAKNPSDLISLSRSSLILSIDNYSKKRLLYQSSYFFSNEKQLNYFQVDDQLQIKPKNKFKNLRDFLTSYEKNKEDNNLQDKASELIAANQLLKQKVKFAQIQQLVTQIQSILQQLDRELKDMEFYELSIGPDTLITKNIFTIIHTLCLDQFRSILFKNKDLMFLVRNQHLVKILLQNFQVFSLKDRSDLISYFSYFHGDSLKILNLLKNKIISSEKAIQLQNISFGDFIKYFQSVFQFKKKYFSNETVNDFQSFHHYVQKILPKQQQNSLNNMQKFLDFLIKNRIRIKKEFLLEYYKQHQKALKQNFKQNFKVFGVLVQLLTSQISEDKPDDIDAEIKAKGSQYLDLYLQIENKNLIQQQSLNLLLIMQNINSFKLDLLKTVDENFFKKLQTTPLQDIKRNIIARIKLYEFLKKDQSKMLIIQRQNLTYKHFIEKLIANLYNQGNMSHSDIIILIQMSKKNPFQSEYLKKILKKIRNERKKIQVQNVL